ncbi:MAG: DALR anticodon-binding domain-containing protein [Xenococcaceae cyanobacterium MO_188.B29]|nr:DALR anticodon-binding domain-containing protein [Xenococcaceae cyanobacterium MO_188.B29]
MDTNVSKNTPCHKFSKLYINRENLAVKKLLRQHILESIKRYQSLNQLNVEFETVKALIAHKITLCDLSKVSSLDIVYRCAIAFPLANYWHLSPLILAQNLKEFLLTRDVISETRPILIFEVKVVSAGWIDFCMSDRALAVWLDEVIQWASQGLGSRGAEEQGSFFEIQYAHARCCSLLRLGHQEKLIKIKYEYSEWAIVEPITLSWVNTQGVFLLVDPTERCLLIQLLTVVEQLIDPSKKVNWTRLAHNLSTVFLDFWAECRIYGEVKQKTPDLAQARLGLVALVQHFLYRILRYKLSVIPLTEI